ncbi:MAG: hypothetical protein JW770_07095 [Actinobacteria bacterium]|nr:hypothetical protein [Actinomycetota bacterium]
MNGNTQLEISILKNEIIAEKLIKEKKPGEAERLLRRNVELKSGSYRTYDLLLKILREKGSYNDVIKVLNSAIRNSKEKEKAYRELRKVAILNELIKNISER